MVTHIPYWILVVTLHHLVEFSVVTRPLSTLNKNRKIRMYILCP